MSSGDTDWEMHLDCSLPQKELFSISGPSDWASFCNIVLKSCIRQKVKSKRRVFQNVIP